MRTETDPTESNKDWTPFGPKVEKPVQQPDEWQKVPDAPGVEYNWKTGKTRTNIPLPFARMEDLAMMERDKGFDVWGDPFNEIRPFQMKPSTVFEELNRYVQRKVQRITMIDSLVYGVGAAKISMNPDGVTVSRVIPKDLYK